MPKPRSSTIGETVSTFLERQVGLHSVPLALLRAIRVNGEHQRGSVRVPFATTERGLVASTNRGCKAITADGGATVRVLSSGLTRAPAFSANSIEAATETYRYLATNGQALMRWREARSKHIRLVDVFPLQIGRFLYVRLKFDCGDAMGGNAVTLLGDRISRRLARERDIRFETLSSNFCSDKKPAAVNAILHRGHYVTAGIRLSEPTLTGILKTNARDLARAALIKLHIGSSVAGAPHHQNSHVANVIAGLFLALGQDIAQVVESSASVLTVEEAPRGAAYVALTMTSLEVGAWGGGSSFPPNRAALRSIGCIPNRRTPGRAAKALAETIAAVSLAGEVSLLASLAEGSLAKATMRLSLGPQTNN